MESASVREINPFDFYRHWLCLHRRSIYIAHVNRTLSSIPAIILKSRINSYRQIISNAIRRFNAPSSNRHGLPCVYNVGRIDGSDRRGFRSAMKNHECVIFDRTHLAGRLTGCSSRKYRRADKSWFNDRSSENHASGASCVDRRLATMKVLDYTLVI